MNDINICDVCGMETLACLTLCPDCSKASWKKSKELLSKSKMIRLLIKYYSKRDRDYLYNDFYKLTNFTLNLLLKEKNLKGAKQ